VALVFDQDLGVIRGFLNGQEFGRQFGVGELFNHRGNVIIGGARPDFFKGVIDEVQLFDRALTASEVNAIYEAQRP